MPCNVAEFPSGPAPSVTGPSWPLAGHGTAECLTVPGRRGSAAPLSVPHHTHPPPHRRSREPSARQSQAWREERVTGSGQPTVGRGAGRSHFSRHPWAVPVPWAPIQGSRKTLGCPGGAYTPGLFLKGLVTRWSWPSEGAAVLLKALDMGPAGCLAAWKTPE